MPYYTKKAHKEIKIKEKGFKQIQRDSTILDILSADGYIVPSILDVYIVSRKSKGFYEAFRNMNTFIK